MFQLFSHDVYCLLDLGSTISYVTPYVVVHFSFGVKTIPEPLSISTLIGEFIMARNIYRGCVMSIYYR